MIKPVALLGFTVVQAVAIAELDEPGARLRAIAQ